MSLATLNIAWSRCPDVGIL